MIIIIVLFQIYIDWFRFKPDYVRYAQSGYSNKGSFPNGQSSNNANFGRIQTTASEEDENAGPELGNTTGLHARAFDHPALWKKQPVIWIADDPLGIGKFETARINNARVEASIDYAHMDARGNLEVQRGPPDEAWFGGYSAQ